MEQPVLNQKSSFKSYEAPLWTIPENIQLPESPALLKDRLVFGSTSFLGSFKKDEELDAKEGNEEERLIFDLEGTDLRMRPDAAAAKIAKEREEILEGNKKRKAQVLPKKVLKKSRTAPAMTASYSRRGSLDKPRLKSAVYIVKQAAVGFTIYLAIGIGIYTWKWREFTGSTTMTLIDALYFSIVTMCTIGYGDITPVSSTTKIYCCIFVLIGFGIIDILLSGMVAYILERQEALIMGAVEGDRHKTAKRYLVNTQEGRMRKRMKVVLALAVVVSCLAFGTVAVHGLEKLSWIDSFYLSCMSVTTVGYGDYAFSSLHGRLFASIWLLVSTLAVGRALLFLAEARINRRNRLIAKWVLKREMTVGDLVAADIDNDGYVSKSEYVVYKLKELGKISEDEIMQVCYQFNILDADNSGRITLSCLSTNVV